MLKSLLKLSENCIIYSLAMSNQSILSSDRTTCFDYTLIDF